MSLEDDLRRHVEILAVDIGRRSVLGGDGLDRAEAYVHGAFDAAGLDVTRQSYDYRDRTVANLIATLPGGDDRAPYYLVGAHYDTVPTTPGADDNASAVAVLLELARRLPAIETRAPVRLAAFTLEESPAYHTRKQGSRVYARLARKAGERVLGAAVLEMVGYTAPRQHYPFVLKWAGYPKQGNFIGVIGDWRSKRFGQAVLKGFEKNGRPPVESLFVPLRGWVLPVTRLSDHASFWDHGYPALMITDTAFMRNPHYHLPSDTIDTLDFGFMVELVESLTLALAELPAT